MLVVFSLKLSQLNDYNHDDNGTDSSSSNNNDNDVLSKLRHEAKLQVKVCFNVGTHTAKVTAETSVICARKVGSSRQCCALN